MVNDFNSTKHKGENATFTTVAEEHLREAERLKKAWFDHVLSSLEKLSANVTMLSTDLHMAKDNLFKDIIANKEQLRKEIRANKAEVGIDIDKLEKRIEKSIDNVNKSIDSISVQTIKDELKRDLADLKVKINEEITLLRKENLPLRDNVTNLKVKVTMWGIIGGIGATVTLSIIFEWVLPLILKSLR